MQGHNGNDNEAKHLVVGGSEHGIGIPEAVRQLMAVGSGDSCSSGAGTHMK